MGDVGEAPVVVLAGLRFVVDAFFISNGSLNRDWLKNRRRRRSVLRGSSMADVVPRRLAPRR